MRRRPGVAVRCAIGSVIVNTAPRRSARFAATMVPCMASTKPREIASPSPVPGADLVGLLRAVELVEDVLEIVLRNAFALVDDLQGDRVADRARCE